MCLGQAKSHALLLPFGPSSITLWSARIEPSSVQLCGPASWGVGGGVRLIHQKLQQVLFRFERNLSV